MSTDYCHDASDVVADATADARENCDASGIASVANVAASAVSVMLRAGSVKAVARIRAAANVSAIQLKLSESNSTVRSTTAVNVSLMIGLPTVGEILVSFSGLYVDWINVTTSPTSSPTRSPTTYAPTYSPTYSQHRAFVLHASPIRVPSGGDSV